MREKKKPPKRDPLPGEPPERSLEEALGDAADLLPQQEPPVPPADPGSPSRGRRPAHP